MQGSKFFTNNSSEKTTINLHKNACGESTVATFLLTEDTIKNFLREFYTNSFRWITLARLIMLLPQSCPQQKDMQGLRLVASSIVFWKKLYFFEDNLWWNTFHNPPSIQGCSKLNTGDLLEDSDVDQFWNFIEGQKK